MNLEEIIRFFAGHARPTVNGSGYNMEGPRGLDFRPERASIL
jgi:hypothetical protein